MTIPFAVDATSHATIIGGATSTTLTWSHTCTNASILLIQLCDSGIPTGGHTVNTVAYSGVAGQLVKFLHDGNWEATQMWVVFNPPAGAANIVATWATNATAKSGGAISFRNARLGLAFTALGANTANPSFTSLDAEPGDFIVGSLASDVGNLSGTTPAGTQIWEDEDGNSGDDDYNAQYTRAISASTPLSWTSAAPGSGNFWVAVGVTVKPFLPRIQSTVTATGGIASGATITFPQAVIVGDMLCGQFRTNSGTMTTVVDSVNGAWKKLTEATVNVGATNELSFWYCLNTAAGTPVVTLTFTGGTTSRGEIAEYKGPKTRPYLATVTSGTSAAPATSNLKAVGPTLAITGTQRATGTALTTWPDAWWLVRDDVDVRIAMLDQVTEGGTLNGSVTLAGSDTWGQNLILFALPGIVPQHKVVYQDTFNRADAGNLGAAWTTGFSLDAKQATAGTGADQSALLTGITPNGDQWAEITFNTIQPGGGTGTGQGIQVRSASTYTGYWIIADSDVGLGVYRWGAGPSVTNSFGAPYPMTWVNGDRLRVEARTVGATVELRMFQNDLLCYVVTDSDAARVLTDGYGMTFSSSTAANPHYNDFRGGNLSATVASGVHKWVDSQIDLNEHTFPYPAKPGDLLMVFYRAGGTAAPVTSITDDFGTSGWVDVHDTVAFSGGLYFGVWYKYAVGGETGMVMAGTSGIRSTLVNLAGLTLATAPYIGGGAAVAIGSGTTPTSGTVSLRTNAVTFGYAIKPGSTTDTPDNDKDWIQLWNNRDTPEARVSVYADYLTAGSRTFVTTMSGTNDWGAGILSIDLPALPATGPNLFVPTRLVPPSRQVVFNDSYV